MDQVEFHAFYQPVVILAGNHTVSMEALARWDVPGVESIPPNVIMPHVQRSPMLSHLLTTSTLNEVCGQLVEWRRRPEMTALTCSVNVTGSDASGGDLFETSSVPSTTADFPRRR